MPALHRTTQSSNYWEKLGQAIGHTRYVVLVAVLSVLLVALSLFLLAAYEAVSSVLRAWPGMITGDMQATQLTVLFLHVVVLMLEAVAFFLIGVSLYGLFITPLNVTEALGVETLGDLEDRILSVIVVILAVMLLESFIEDAGGLHLLSRAGAFALVVLAIVGFQLTGIRAKSRREQARLEAQRESKRKMFKESDEVQEIGDEGNDGTQPAR